MTPHHRVQQPGFRQVLAVREFRLLWLVSIQSLLGTRSPVSPWRCWPSTASAPGWPPPRLTGLWQVSGRADLTWEESIRLDLRVENWSMAMDATIRWEDAGRGASGQRRLLTVPLELLKWSKNSRGTSAIR